MKEDEWAAEAFPIPRSKDGFAVELSAVKVYQLKEGLHRWRDIWD
jgi:hypothetical protein